MPKVKSEPRFRIGFALDDSIDERDGVQQYMITVGEWMRSRGHEVHYLVSNSKSTDIVNVHSLGRNISVRFNGNRMNTPLLAPKKPIIELVKELNLDVLHVQVPYSPFLAGRIIKSVNNKTAVVGTFHILPESWIAALASRVLAFACQRTLRRFDKVVSVSIAAKHFASDTFRIPSDVLPNAINLKLFNAAPVIRLNDQKHKNILFLGRLVPRKGCMLLLNAINLLKDDAEIPPFKLTVCGKGPLLTRLEEYVVANNLEKIVHFAGFVSELDKPKYYASADLSVFPSTGGESFGIVLVEAMASGNSAVIAGTNPGYSSVLMDCPDSVLFNPRDIESFAATIKTYLIDDGLRKRVKSWQKEYVKRFDINVVGPKLVHTYETALSVRRSMP